RQNRNPLSAPSRLHDVDLVALERASYIALLIAQDSGKNQPLRTLEARQNLDQQFAEQVRGDNVDLPPRFPAFHIATTKFYIVDFVQSRVSLGGRDCNGIVVDSKNARGSKMFGCERENSAARSKIDNRPAWFPFAGQLFKETHRHHRRRVQACSKRRSSRND